MHSSSEEPDKVEKRICNICIRDAFLSELVAKTGTAACCSYCAETELNTFTIEELADVIEKAFEDHYERTPTEPDGFEAAMNNDSESSYEWERKGEEVMWAIANAAGIEEEAAEDVLSLLQDRHSDHEAAEMGDECEFDKSSHYEEKAAECEELTQKWFDFEHRLKTEARFFSPKARLTLDEIFEELSLSRTFKGSSVIVTAGPGTAIESLHRARVFAEDEKLEGALKEPWIHLGPPTVQAASAGRMNARGISVFYGAMDAVTALSEVRPPVGSKVSVAKFTILRPLQLLDVEALQTLIVKGSVFDPTFLRRLQRAKFLEIFSELVSRSVMPHEEALEYLPTQAVAEYLATEAKLDGMVFPSVQVGHRSSNVVLFHHSSRVEGHKLKAGTKLEASLEWHDSDGASPDYRVWERVPSAPGPALQSDLMDLSSADVPYHTSFDPRLPSLKIEFDNIEVHHVKGVTIVTARYPVVRHVT